MTLIAKHLKPEEQRKLAAALFNHTWELIGKDDRSRKEESLMIHAAHSSRYLWEDIGTPVNRAVGEWQVSRVYAALRRAEPALYHAQRCLDHIEEGGVEGFYRASAYEGMARALSVAGDPAGCRKYLDLAVTEGEKVTETEDKELLFEQLAEIPEYTGPTGEQ